MTSDVIKVSYIETARSVETKPSFGIDINPVGLDKVNKYKIPEAVPGTFYDLFAPATSKKEERLKIEKEKAAEPDGNKKRTRITTGNPKNYYTFKALLKTYLSKFLPELFEGYNLPVSFAFTESSLNSYFYMNGSKLADKVVVKKVGNVFNISLPLFTFNIKTFSDTLKDNVTSATGSEARDEAYRFVSNFWKRKLRSFPVDFYNPTGNIEIDKIVIATEVDSSYPKAKDFYRKYCTGFTLKSKLAGVGKAPVRLALPSPNSSNSSSSGTYPVLNSPKRASLEADTLGYDERVFGTNLVATDFTLFAEVYLPVEEAKFYVQSVQPKEFEILDFVHSWYMSAMSTQGSSAYPTYKHSMVSVREKNKPFEEFAVPTVNKDKIALTKQNNFIYLPNIELIDQYRESMIQATYDHESDSYCFEHNAKALPRNHLIYVDWVNKRVAYTTADAKLKSINLAVLYPVKASNYLKHLHTICNAGAIDIVEGIIAKTKNLGLLPSTINQRTFDVVASGFAQYNRIAMQSAYTDISKYIKGGSFEVAMFKFYDLFFHNVNNPDFVSYNDTKHALHQIDYPFTFVDVLQNPVFKPLADILFQVFVSVFKDDTTILSYINDSKKDVPTSLKELAFLLPFRQIKNYDKILDLTLKDNAPYRDQDNIDINTPINLKNFDGVDVMLRHQGKTFKKLEKQPLIAVIGTAAGGGKTITAVADIMNALGQGYVTAPLVLCPNGLIKDYVNEINYVSKGKINAIPFDTSVFNNYANMGTDDTGNVTWDYTKLKALIDNAPINTIVILGYDVIAGATTNKALNVYGNEVYETYSHLEFFASCQFDGVWCDESHYLKGGESLRVLVNEILIAPIKYKRLLTGTIVPNTLVDLVRQLMLLDPSILGTEMQFRKTFSFDGAISGTFIPADGAIDKIYAVIKQQCTFINVQRKEWAAQLPKLYEYYVESHLTPNQRKVYNILIKQEVDKLEQSLTGEEVDALEDISTSEESDELVERIFDNSIGNLSAVEAFLANPVSVQKNLKEMLTEPEDQLSPKGTDVAEICRTHLSQPEKYPGKILIFCNTHAAVAGIWNALPSDIKEKTIYYSAAKKADFEREFNTNPNKKIMLGVSDSLDTGLNLQIADTIIRVDTVWTPGKLEQGNARINRPNLKSVNEKGERYDPRKANGIHIYYIAVDRTIDVIKIAKLTSKTVTLAKFYNSGGPDSQRYKYIGLDEDGNDITPLRVSFELLRQGLSFDELDTYKKAYEELRSLEHAIYDEYAQMNPEELAPLSVHHNGILEGSKVLRNVPYVAGAGIFNADQLGLVPYLTYKQKWISDNPDEEWNPEGLLIHSEFGDGDVIKETGSTVHLNMNKNGIRLAVSPSKIFVVTKKLTSSLEIRDQLVKTTGLESIDIQLDTYREQVKHKKMERRLEKEKLAEQKRQAKEAIRRKREEEIEERKNKKVKLNPVEVVQDDDTQEDEDEYSNDIEVKLTLFNDMLGLNIISEDPESEIGMFKKYGCILTKPYLAAEIKRKDALETLLDKMQSLLEAGHIYMEQDLWDMWGNIEAEFKQGRSKLLQVSQTPKSEIVHFLMTNFRKVRTPTTIRALPMIVDGKLYMVIDIGSHNSATVNKIRRTVVSGVTWKVHEPELLGLYTNKTAVKNAVTQMKKDGWNITNEKDLSEYFTRTKVKSK